MAIRPDSRSVGKLLGAVARGVEVIGAATLLILALPLMAVLAVAVRYSSHGPVLHRDRGLDNRGRPVELLSFRTRMDGAATVAHERLRAVVGGRDGGLTGAGRIMQATRTDRLPRLVNVLAGHVGLFRR